MAVRFDFKSFLVNHSEKLIGIIVVVIALWGFASASWKQAEVTPAQLEQQARKVRETIDGNTVWPEAEQEGFTLEQNVQELAAELARRDDNMSYQQFATRAEWNPLLNPLRKKRSRVVVLAPTDPEIEPISVALALVPDEEELPENDVMADKEEPEEEEVDEGRRRAANEYGRSGGRRPQPGAGAGGGRGQSGNVAFAFGLGRRPFGAGRGRGGADDDDDDYYPGARGAASAILPTANRKVEWRAGVSVRMIVSFRKQRQEIAKALHIKGNDVQTTGQFVDYQQMHIERKEYRFGQWSDWEPLLLEDVGEVLTESLGQDVDIVSSAVTRDGITMQLPRRAAGTWGPHQASHERLENFELDEDEQEIMNTIMAIMARDAEEARKNQPPVRKRRRGFSEFTQSAQDLRRDLNSGIQDRAGWRNNVRSEVSSVFQQRGGFDERRQQMFQRQMNQLTGTDEEQEEEATADERLLLVRFFDFTAERGLTYRYRVRLEMYNPNYNVNVDELESPELRNEETIFSDWSEATAAVTVPMRYRTHPAKVKNIRGTQKMVEFGVFYEGEGVLPVFENVTVPIGLPIGGMGRSDRVDLEKEILEVGDVDVRTDEILAGVISEAGLSGRDHDDLREVLAAFSRRDKAVGDIVTMVDSAGNIEMRFVSESAGDLEKDSDTAAGILEEYEDWRRSNNGGPGNGAFAGLDEDEIEDARRNGRGGGLRMGSALGRTPGRGPRGGLGGALRGR